MVQSNKEQTMSTNRNILLSATAAVLLAAAVGTNVYAGQHAEASAPPAAEQAIPVQIAEMKTQPVQLWAEFSARLHAVDFAEIRPEVSGRIMDIRFKDGQTVKPGDVLLVIDPSPYQAAVARAEANLASAKNNVDFTQAESSRAEGLIATQAISQSMYDERINAHRMAEAARLAAEAELRQAKLDLDHAYVKAPIGGQVSRAEITVGNLVQAGANAPLLTSIASNDGIYADFEIDEQTYLHDIRVSTAQAGAPVAVTLNVPGDKKSYEGRIQSFDNRIDSATGTIRARAVFANTDHGLLPGMTVTVRIAENGGAQALLIPQSAVGTDQDKKFVYMVNASSKATYREIELGKSVDNKRVVLSGLKPGDRVIVDGLQYLHPDALVTAAVDTPPAQPAKR